MAQKKDLIDGLNIDLAAEWGTIIRYTYQAAKCTGLVGEELRDIFQREAKDEIEHASFLMDVITDLGGEPTTQPKSIEKPNGIKAMLELDIKLEEEDVKHYMAHAQLADELGFVELKVKLEEMAADEAGHARELRRLCKGL